jgi:hypothetical protein
MQRCIEMNRDRNWYGAFLLSLAFAFAPLSALAQYKQTSKPVDKMVFEVVREGWAKGRVGAHTLRLFRSGRVTYEEASSKMGQEKYHTEKTASAQFQVKKISDLIMLANQADFLNAKGEYKTYSAGIDAGQRGQVIYFGKRGKQTIELAPYQSRRGQSAELLPESLKEFLRKVSEIENLMEGKLRK